MAVDGQLPRTRASLLRLRQSLAEAREGYELLERKREVLLREVWRLMRDAGRHEEQVRDRFRAAHAALRTARLDAGSETVRWALLAPSAQTTCRVEMRNLMGVTLPSVELSVVPERLTTSVGGTPVALDDTRRRWLEVAEVLARWAETSGSAWRVAAELARTQRRVAALEQVLIPEFEEGIRAIEASLEEADREGFVRTKRVKDRLEREGSEADHA
jgi:V/A-type H+-transporting ATPase subunit D